MLKYARKEKSLIHQEYAYFSVILSAYRYRHDFKEVWYHKYPEEREVWCTSIWKEFKDKINRGVWEKSKRTNMSPNRRLIDSKWVFKKKTDIQFRERFFAREYTQILVVEFTKKWSPVVTDVTLRGILLIWFIKKWEYQTIDIETEF